MSCYKNSESMMMAACYKNGNDDKSDNNEDKVYFLLKRWGLMSHILDHLLDHMIIGLVTTALHSDKLLSG